MDGVQLHHGYRATTSHPQVPRNSWYSFDWPSGIDLVFLNTSPLDWESSVLTTRPCSPCSWTIFILTSFSLYTQVRAYFRLKLSLNSGCSPWWLISFKNVFYQNNCKEAMNIGGAQIRHAHFDFFVVRESALFCIFWTLPLVSKITPTGHANFDFNWCSICTECCS